MLFTAPGERVNRPTFGSGLMQLVFAPNSDELAATTQFLVQGALQQWLGDLIVVEAVEVEADDAHFAGDDPVRDPAHADAPDRRSSAAQGAAHDLLLLRSAPAQRSARQRLQRHRLSRSARP